jgi:hypothetical protein
MTSQQPDSPRRSWPRRLLNRLEVDRAVFAAVSLRVWQLLAGVGTLLLMTVFFSEETQDFYYTFASLMALQTFFELGFNIAIINTCSHEWAKLDLDDKGRIVGDARALSRLVSLGRLLFKWYAVAQLLFILIVGFCGAWFLSQRTDAEPSWQQPWTALVIVSGLLLWTLPFNAVLEGCNQVTAINTFRLIQGVLASLAVWTVMMLGGGLWAAVAATTARLLCDLYLVLVHYREFFHPFFRPPAGESMHWRQEVWPMQWRLAISGVTSYFAFFLFTPVMFHYHDDGVAGQMGMTWTVVTAIQAAALAWIQTRAPRFGILVNERDFAELDRVFFRVAFFAVWAMLGASVAFWLLLKGINVLQWKVAGRLLGPLPTGVFLVAAGVQLLATSLVFYVRAHKREPFMIISTISSCAIGLAVWQLGSRFGPLGAAFGFLAVQALITLPVHLAIWRRCRLQWH